MNSASISGYVGQDPELRTTQSGIKVATYSIGVYRANPKDKTKPLTDWFNVIAWGDLAESVMKNVHKSSYVLTNGKFQTRSYEKDGKKVVVTEFMSNDIWLAPPKDTKEDTGSTQDELPF